MSATIKLNEKQQVAVNVFTQMIKGRIVENAKNVTYIQRDPELGSVLCKIDFENHKAVVWMKTNGGVRTIDGKTILIANSKIPKRKINIKLTDILS